MRRAVTRTVSILLTILVNDRITDISLVDEEEDEEEDSSETEHTLLPLIEAFNFSQKSWDEVLSSSTTTIEKIAEASYAEVYRCTNAEGTSILKVMQLKVSSDPASLDISTAHIVEDVIAELRIMNDLTTLPGFVTFKDAYLIKGKPVSQIKKAWDAWVKKSNDESQFPDPDTFGPKSTFLVIELGDAGEELEATPMKTIEQVWDVLLGVIIALARAESTNEFEVRPSFPLFSPD